MQVTSLYICPWSLRDPLCQSQTLPYLRGLNADEGYKIALITSENPKFAVRVTELAKVKKELEEQGIYWYPGSYHPGLSLFAKAYDNAAGIALGLRVCRKHKPRFVHSRSSLPTLVAVTLARLCRINYLYDADSMLSEEYADNGHWSRRSRGFRIMAAAENLARRSATRIIVLSDLLKQDLQNYYGVKTPVDVIPCCVDTEKFRSNQEARARRRSELGLKDEKLFVYVGKIGGRYLVGEMFDFYKAARSEFASSRLLVVSQESPDSFKKIAAESGVGEDSFFIRNAAPDEVGEYLSASDAGLALIKSTNSERGSSPIKVAEYLAAGLPVIITGGVGDCSNLIAEKRVGAVLEETNFENYSKVLTRMSEIWAEDAADLSARCRRTAEENFSLEKVGVARYRSVYQKLLAGK